MVSNKYDGLMTSLRRWRGYIAAWYFLPATLSRYFCIISKLSGKAGRSPASTLSDHPFLDHEQVLSPTTGNRQCYSR